MPQPRKPNRFKETRRGAVIYARYSPRPNEECRSIESQYGQCEKYCEFQNWRVMKKFRDEQASGTGTIDRSGLLEAIAYCKANKAVLVCYKLNRLARNVVDALLTLDDLRKHECDVVLLDILADTTTPSGRMLFTIMASLAEFQAAEIGTITSDAMRHHQKNEYCMGGVPPYGWKRSSQYDVVNFSGIKKRRYKLTYDEKEQEVLDLAIRLRDRGWGIRQIAKNLNLLGYKSRTGGTFKPSTVMRMLDREKAGLNPTRLTANPRYARSLGLIVPPGAEAITDEPSGSAEEQGVERTQGVEPSPHSSDDEPARHFHPET